MLFNSLTFLAFFAVVYASYWSLPGWNAKKNLLLAASYVFYGAWNPPYVFLLAFSTVLDWSLARAIGRAADARRRKFLLCASLCANLGLLGYFKYGAFLLDSFSALCAALGFAYTPPAADIVLPIGISFYTFASLSYTIDVYRGEVNSRWSLRDYALFVSFFPHLVAGPIVRAKVLLPQIVHPWTPTRDQVAWGSLLVLFGLFSKVVLADHLFAPMVDAVYAAPHGIGALDAWAAVFAFSGQIYFDFSGYSHCAIGLALCFGFAFPDNFRYPYAALGFSDFWRRWHISLSTWLRDYLYIPLGGNRHGDAATMRNLMLTMLLGGLWHGASWMFVLWGFLHGACLVGEKAWRGWTRRSTEAASNRHELAVAFFTFLAISIIWIPFRAPDVATAATMLGGLLRIGTDSRLYSPDILLGMLCIAATFLWHFVLRRSSFEEAFVRLAQPARLAAVAACLVCLYLVSGGSGRAFIYYQF